MMASGLREAVVFDEPTTTTGSLGGEVVAWSDVYSCRAQWIYQSGGEAVQAARYAGRSLYKIKIRSCPEARALTTDHRMRDTRRATVWNIREVDAITDPRWIYIVVEGLVVS